MADEVADVLVIGSGPSGAAVTKRLTDLGAKVVCLEQGDWMRPSEYPATKPDWEALSIRGPFCADPNVRRLPQDYPVTYGGKMHSIIIYNAVGGTLQDGMYSPRLRPSDFRARTLDGVADDWPIGHDDLIPYWEMDERERGVSGVAGDPGNPPRGPYPMPQLPIGVIGETMGRGFDKLGWHWWPIAAAIPSVEWEGRPACMQHGKCHDGCAVRVKGTPDITLWPKSLAKGAVLKTWSRVREVTLDSQGRATGALYFDRQGNVRQQLARVVVVSCNGVGTPRLLLNSKSKLFPQGLANSSGLVGKNFMSHVWATINGTFEQPMDGTTAVPLIITSQEFYESDAKRGFVRGYNFLLHDAPGPVGHSRGVVWGAEHHRAMRKRFPHVVTLSVLGDDLPEEKNRVELDPDVKDSNGIPAARITYDYCENSVKMQEHGMRAGKQVMEAAGAIEVSLSAYHPTGSHLLGTARMGNDPKTSVVNAWNQAHDVKNLFIVDGSSFVTSAPTNPTSTMVALGFRAADGIWKRRQEWT